MKMYEFDSGCSKSEFPLLIKIDENVNGYEKGKKQIVFFPVDLPQGVSFTVLKTNYYEN